MTATQRIGFIGAGAMSQAIVAGLVRSGEFSAAAIGVTDKTGTRAARLNERFGIAQHASVPGLAANSDLLCLCVKPRDVQHVADQLESVSLEGKLLISAVAGINLSTLRKHFPAPLSGPLDPQHCVGDRQWRNAVGGAGLVG